MRERLPGSTYDSFKQSVEDGTPLDGNVADQVSIFKIDSIVSKRSNLAITYLLLIFISYCGVVL